MQPELPTSPSGNERLPVHNEQYPEVGQEVSSGERSPERSAEQREQQAETAARAAEKARNAPQGAPPMPTPVQAPPATQPMVTADDTPATAADEDLIEKEWVDKAKKIIVSTQEDPAERERQVAKLQADYLNKRYGKKLGASE